MSKPYIQSAAYRLAEPANGNKVGEFDPSVWFDFLLRVIGKLLACRPDAGDAYNYLTWRPWRILDPFGWRLAEHRRRATAAMVWSWDGDLDQGKAAAETVWAAIDAGRFSRGLLHGCYSDLGGKSAG